MLRAQSLLPNLPQETLEFACDLVLEQICNYCNLTEAPDGLANTAALMVRGLVNSVQLQNENMQPAAKGVSRGDTSFSFATAAEQLAATGRLGRLPHRLQGAAERLSKDEVVVCSAIRSWNVRCSSRPMTA